MKNKETIMTNILIGLGSAFFLFMVALSCVFLATGSIMVCKSIPSLKKEPITLVESVPIQKISKYSLEKSVVDGGGVFVAPTLNLEGEMSMTIVPEVATASKEKYDTYQYWIVNKDGSIGVKDFYETYKISIYDDKVRFKTIPDSKKEKLNIFGKKSSRNYESYVFELHKETIQMLQSK